MSRLSEQLDKARNEEDVVTQSLAMIDIVKDLLDATKKQLKAIYILLAISLLCNLAIVGAFLWYESQFEYEVTTETVTTQTVDGENSSINNIEGNQYNDSSVHNEGGID